ncbi:uncharacterized protein LOC115740177 isoform X2 [Rhodamnia argentea]|uniref:Uncharacterized protein LOC115740177 isoform X2 n=1 Tax=Rhodamnia argentea TaxID=178133 RepID=A0A8B8P3R2_9MYRT|nr:uncharacterized protein LOC115740177 isoform X2 [Rhodamnia argentea]
MTSVHKRSNSFPGKKRHEEDSSDVSAEGSHRVKLDVGYMTDTIESKAKPSTTGIKVHSALKREILQLEKRLKDQLNERHALEKALGLKSSSSHGDPSHDASMPKPVAELIKEIAILEYEVMYLEQYLLSLYRKAFNQQIPPLPPSNKEKRIESPLETPRGSVLELPRHNSVALQGKNAVVQSGRESLTRPSKDYEEKPFDSMHRCRSSLLERLVRTSPQAESAAKALRPCQSQPVSMMEYAQNTPLRVVSLAEHLGARISDHVPETLNKLSEDMVKCMSGIYCKLADSPLTHNSLSSPGSSLSLASAFSPRDQLESWSPGFGNSSSFDVCLDNPFHVDGLKDFSGPYSTMIEVAWLHRDSQKLGDIEDSLRNFRSLISRLEEVDPRKLKHEEKLAFWINIHNALVMHAFLAYGIPQNNGKRILLLLKAAYNVGGHTISAGTIQSSILGCRLSRPGQWLRLLLSMRSKFKTGDPRQAYAVKQSEPLLHFALCCGSHSDPAVRLYTPKRVFQELETAKDEYIRATFGVRKDQKILLPKVVESFAKDSGLSPAGVVEMIQLSLPESFRKTFKRCQLSKSRKNVEWIPHNFGFRYLITKELVK